MFRIGLQAINLDRLTEFYKTAPRYLVTGRDRRDTVGDLPTSGVVFLTRDLGKSREPSSSWDGAPTRRAASDSPVSTYLRFSRLATCLNASARTQRSATIVRSIMTTRSRFTAMIPRATCLSRAVNRPSAYRHQMSGRSTAHCRTKRCCASRRRDVELIPGFMMREERKARARPELPQSGPLEAEEPAAHIP